ncbi:MAG: 3-oxoacyl-ACP synthase, partial [Tannerella sp.]|nr:3-oxoacyl-ACP synthase [Tannerella sp.]
SGCKGDAGAFLTEVYYWLGVDYRRFFKMDLLSKLGWLTSEWLMAGFDPEEPKEDMGIVFFNSSSSLDTDRRFQETIRSREACFPSPAGFVYTLPNIVAGEVAIRHRIYGETAFYVLPRPEVRPMKAILCDTLASAKLNRLLTGWLEACGDTLDARVMLCTNDDPENGE